MDSVILLGQMSENPWTQDNCLHLRSKDIVIYAIPTSDMTAIWLVLPVRI